MSKLIPVIILLIVVFQGCKKNNIENWACQHDMGEADDYVKTVYNEFKINPKNETEIIYTTSDYSIYRPLRHDLYLYNYKTNQKIKLADDIWMGVDIGMSEWVTFRNTNGKIFMIKTNGDSLTQLSTYSGFIAGINHSGNILLYWEEINNNLILIKQNLKTFEKTNLNLTNIGRGVSWIPNDSGFCYSRFRPSLNYQEVYYYNLSTGISKFLFKSSENEQIAGLSWFNDAKRIIYANDSGIFELDLSTKSKRTITKNCKQNGRLLAAPLLSSDNKRVFVLNSFSLKKTRYVEEFVNSIDCIDLTEKYLFRVLP
jgi:protease II